jgi:hypothetical protein
MKISTLRRSVSGVVAIALVAAGAALTAAPASAAVFTTLSTTPTSGNALAVPTWTTVGACPTGNLVTVKIFGGSGTGSVIAAPGKNINGAIDVASYLNATGGMTIPSSQQWSSWATNGAPVLAALNGTYTISANCANGDQYQGTVTFVGTDTTTATFTANANPIPTTTTHNAPNPATPTTFGTPVVLSATVAAGAGLGTPTGTVNFLEGATTVGSAPLVAGVATTTPGVTLNAGTHVITAAYTPDAAGAAAGFQASTGAATQTITVNQGTATVAVTGPASIGQGQAGTINVAVTPATAGTFDLAYSIGGAAAVPIITGQTVSAAGTGSFLWNVGAGQTLGTNYAIIATFHPTSTNVANNATGTLTPFAVTAAAGVVNNETIQVTVPAGALSATVVNNPVVVLGNFTLSSDGSYNTATGAINPIQIIDTRAGDLGWTLSAKATNFVGCGVYSTVGLNYYSAAPVSVYSPATVQALIPSCTPGFATLAANAKAYDQQAISNANLGIAASLATSTTTSAQVGTTFTPNIGVAAQAAVNPDLRLPAFVTPAGSPFGLALSRNLVVGTGGVPTANGDILGSATGVVSVNAALTLRIPTVTMNGAYASTLTLTVI